VERVFFDTSGDAGKKTDVITLLYSLLIMSTFCKKEISSRINTHCLLYFVPFSPDDDIPGRKTLRGLQRQAFSSTGL
jgi:hypothetical protein